MHDKYYHINKELVDIIENGIGQKRNNIYFEWLCTQLDLYKKETSPLIIPQTVFPNKITSFAYNKNKKAVQNIIDKYYNLHNNNYIRNSSIIDTNDLEILLNNLVLIRGNVVWVEFGFNVGCEFGGKHPAVILKSMTDELIVVPLSSGNADKSRNYEVDIKMVYNFPKRDRYVSVTRIRNISKYRVDLNSPIGSIKSKDMKKIMNAIKIDYGLF